MRGDLIALVPALVHNTPTLHTLLHTHFHTQTAHLEATTMLLTAACPSLAGVHRGQPWAEGLGETRPEEAYRGGSLAGACPCLAEGHRGHHAP